MIDGCIMKRLFMMFEAILLFTMLLCLYLFILALVQGVIKRLFGTKQCAFLELVD
jgi:hypothetical protein